MWKLPENFLAISYDPDHREITPVHGYMWNYKAVIAGVKFNNCGLWQISALWYMQRVPFTILRNLLGQEEFN